MRIRGLELRHHREHVEQQPDRVSRLADRPTEAQLDVPFGQLFEDVAGIGQRAGEPVQLGDNQRHRPGRRPTPTKAGSVSVRAGQAMVDIDAIVTDAKRPQPVVLRGEILLLC